MYTLFALSTLLFSLALATADRAASHSQSSNVTTKALDASTACSAAPGSSATAGERIVRVVTVGDSTGDLKYFPESICAEPGSIVQFQFFPKNHTVTRSSFADPCQPLAANLTSETVQLIKSGFVPVNGTEAFRPVFNLLVNDTKPIWIYCGQPGHCQKGMAMVINQNTTDTVKTLENYKKAAAQLPLPGVAGNGTGVASSSSSSSTSSATTLPAVVNGATASTNPVASPTPIGANTSGPSLASSTTGVQPAIFHGSGDRLSINLRHLGGMVLVGLAVL